MLTFQILDGAESYYRPLEGRALTIGASRRCDIRLQDSGVLDQHARVRVANTGADTTYWIEAASEDAVVKVNGEAVRQAELGLGDRIELGRSVLVLGQQVRRPATASDVLEQTSSSRVSTRARPPFPLTRVVVSAAVVVAAGLVAVLGQWSQAAPIELPLVEKDVVLRARKAGKFDRGRQIMARIRDWAGQDPMKLVLFEEFEGEFEATAREYDRLREELREGVLKKSRIEQLAWLRDLKGPAHPRAVQEAAQIVAGKLTVFREQDRGAAVARLLENPPEAIPAEATDPSKAEAVEAKKDGRWPG